uniref:DUF3398 domain-containing protein n=1 Tax=Gongylonema pulchrum TaxID=637853 RepID=A0A183DAS5_9BILA
LPSVYLQQLEAVTEATKAFEVESTPVEALLREVEPELVTKRSILKNSKIQSSPVFLKSSVSVFSEANKYVHSNRVTFADPLVSSIFSIPAIIPEEQQIATPAAQQAG